MAQIGSFPQVSMNFEIGSRGFETRTRTPLVNYKQSVFFRIEGKRFTLKTSETERKVHFLNVHTPSHIKWRPFKRSPRMVHETVREWQFGGT